MRILRPNLFHRSFVQLIHRFAGPRLQAAIPGTCEFEAGVAETC
jgi:hypothetical protein